MANNLRRLVGVLLLPFYMGGNPASFAAINHSDTNWSVLEYDEQGNVTNIITREGDDQASDSEILEMLENPANTPQSTPQNTRDTIAIPSHSNEFKKEFLDNEVVIVGLDSGASKWHNCRWVLSSRARLYAQALILKYLGYGSHRRCLSQKQF